MLRHCRMGSFLSVLLRNCRLLVKPHASRSVQRSPTTPAGNPLPPLIHQVVKQHKLGPGRLVLIGDIHGCNDELQQLLSKLKFQHGTDNLILVGDLVNKGPKSQEVIASARTWCQAGYAWVVRGNHDDAALAAQQYLTSGLGPVKGKYSWVHGLLRGDVAFLNSLPFSVQVSGYNILVVHAGLVPGVPLEQQQLGNLTKMRDLVKGPDGSWVAVEKPQEDGSSQPWAGCWQGPHHVFFGHDAKRRLQNTPYATGLDTGCVYGGELTACVLPPLSELQHSTSYAIAAATQSAVSLGRFPEGTGHNKATSVHQLDETAPTLFQLKGSFVSVPSARVYSEPGKQKADGPAAAPAGS